MKELLQRFRYPDINVADCMLEGFPMMDLPGTNGVFGKKHPEDVTHGADPRWLDHMAIPMREELLESMHSQSSSHGGTVDQAVFDQLAKQEMPRTRSTRAGMDPTMNKKYPMSWEQNPG